MNSIVFFWGVLELFIIWCEDCIVGSGVEGVLYFGKDSIYYFFVDVCFEIKEWEMIFIWGESVVD